MTDPERDVFQNALSDFTFEAACGGAIRHLADSGCTAKQIMERLDYPVSGDRVRKALYRHLCDTGVILEKSPEEGIPEAKAEYILEYDSYGKPSYRKKNTTGAAGGRSCFDPAEAVWTETVYEPMPGLADGMSESVSERTRGRSCQGKRKRFFGRADQGDSKKATGSLGRGAELFRFLSEKCSEKREETVYISCDFGIPDSIAAKGIALLNGRQREYLEGIPWPRHRVYHRLDHRMKEMVCSLYQQRAYEGTCYFVLYREKLHIR